MRNLSLNDPTQQQILPHLRVTETLLERVASRLSGRSKSAEIVAMPDLGLPLNVTRIHGGFFTGAFYAWETDVPFVPIDATVNCCSVSVFRLGSFIENQAHFDSVLSATVEKNRTDNTYLWNFDRGNHFVTFATKLGAPDEYYAILHASAAEWKQQEHGLYPTPGNWYWNDVRVETGDDDRFLRYISGATAEAFIERAQWLTDHNRQRLHYFAAALFGDDVEEVVHQPHYGMPTPHSVAIGCQWFPQPYLWLTAPRQSLFLIAPDVDNRNQTRYDDQDLVLTPHGLGLELRASATFGWNSKGITINGNEFLPGTSLTGSNALHIRASDSAEGISEALKNVLQQCPGRVEGVLKPLYSHHKGTLIT